LVLSWRAVACVSHERGAGSGRPPRGKGCLDLRSLDDVDLKVLRQMVVKVAKAR
jgi:hypothetical protein